MLEQFQSDYDKILLSHEACRTILYQAAPCYLIPRVTRGQAVLTKEDGYYLLGQKYQAQIVIPVDLKSPSDYLSTLLNVISRYKAATNVPAPYAMALKNQGYRVIKRPWGNIDWVFDTEALADLPGKRHERKRTYINKLIRQGLEIRELTAKDADIAGGLENLWIHRKSEEGHAGRQGYAKLVISLLDQAPASMRLRAFGLFDQGRIVGFTVGNMLTPSYWACSFRYADNTYQGASLFLFRETARAYRDVPFECDGDASGVGSPLWEFKRRLASEATDKQSQEMYVVLRP